MTSPAAVVLIRQLGAFVHRQECQVAALVLAETALILDVAAFQGCAIGEFKAAIAHPVATALQLGDHRHLFFEPQSASNLPDRAGAAPSKAGPCQHFLRV